MLHSRLISGIGLRVFLVILCGTTVADVSEHGSLWQADLENGEYKNPILFADYSDPDVVRVGEDFYMTASSFNASPGLPILQSKDLINWRLIGHALPHLVPSNNFARPQHGNGVWAPNIRYHNNKFWIFYPDPDFGIYRVNTEDPAKGWSEPLLILAGKGLIDPTPLWDDDGQAWLLHAWAKSRSGKNNILTLHKMSAEATSVTNKGKVIIDGNALPGYRTLEGPKFYKRHGYYYIFAPAGGVPTGWQAVFRSKNIMGPYEYRTVMEQGDTFTNGPHQGAWVDTQSGEDWFIHFQSRLAYGRIVHLQPLTWRDDWPIIGIDKDGDGIGYPVSRYSKPKIQSPAEKYFTPASDNFENGNLGLQWHWNANYQREWYSLSARPGYLRLYAQEEVEADSHNMWMNPSLLLQKLSAPEFIAETTLEFPEQAKNLDAGLLIFGEDYAWIGVQYDHTSRQLVIGTASCDEARKGCTEKFVAEKNLANSSLTLRVTMVSGGGVVFSYLDENNRFRTIGELFQARPGRWVGAKIGLFARNSARSSTKIDYVDIKNISFSFGSSSLGL